MFKAQPGNYALPFAIGVFASSILFSLLRVRSATLSMPIAALLIALGVLSIVALISGFCFWLGLCYQHREPIARTAFIWGAFSDVMANNVLGLFGSSIFIQCLSLGILLTLAFVFGKKMPESSSKSLSVAAVVNPPAE